MTDPGEGPSLPPPTPCPFLCLDQTGRKKIFSDRAPPLYQCLDDRLPPLSEGLDPPLLITPDYKLI